jgi:hypothetical protein
VQIRRLRAENSSLGGWAQRADEFEATDRSQSPRPRTRFPAAAEMSWEQAHDYLYAKVDQSQFRDPEGSRERGLAQFLDEKSIRPGLRRYER